jgi:hypothetical protein
MRRIRSSRRKTKRKRKKKGKTADITYLVVKSLQNVAEESSGVVYAMILKYQNMR